MTSLLDGLRLRTDSRARHGRMYPLCGILALLILAAMHGEPSLRGMWLWGTLPAEQVVRRLGLWRYPSRSTRWSIVRGLDTGIVEEVLRPWLPNDPVDAADGNVRRGSKRAGQRALAVLTLVGQTVGQVLAQRAVEGGNELAAALALLEEVPLEGRVISADAAILKAPLAQKVVKGGYIGPVNPTQPELLKALEEWIDVRSQHSGDGVTHWVEVVKGHGRMEQREGWMVPCETDRQAYLRDAFGWPGVHWCGRIRRQRWTPATGEEEGIQGWVAGAACPWSLDIQTAARYIRGHWTIENRACSVRDMTMDEDRLHGRQIGPAVSSIRNVTLSLLRLVFPGRSMPDAIRLVRALPDGGFSLLTTSLLKL